MKIQKLQEIKHKSIIEPKDFTYTQEEKELYKLDEANNNKGIIKISDKTTAIYFQVGEEITGLQVFSSDTVGALNAICDIIDNFTGLLTHERNAVLSTLGFFNGNFIKGMATKRKGFSFNVISHKNMVVFGMSKGWGVNNGAKIICNL